MSVMKLGGHECDVQRRRRCDFLTVFPVSSNKKSQHIEGVGGQAGFCMGMGLGRSGSGQARPVYGVSVYYLVR